MHEVFLNGELSYMARLVWGMAWSYNQKHYAPPTVQSLSTATNVLPSELRRCLDEVALKMPNYMRRPADTTGNYLIEVNVPRKITENALKRPINDFDNLNPVLTLTKAFDTACAPLRSAKARSKTSSYPVMRALSRKYPSIDLKTELKAFFKYYAALYNTNRPTPTEFRKWLEKNTKAKHD
jgi:hypothetical protein